MSDVNKSYKNKTTAAAYTTTKTPLSTSLGISGRLQKVTIINRTVGQSVVIQVTDATTDPADDLGITLDEFGGTLFSYYFEELNPKTTFLDGSGNGVVEMEFYSR